MASKVLLIKCSLACTRHCNFTPSGIRFSSTNFLTKLNSVSDADGNPISISLNPISTSSSKSSSFCEMFIGIARA